MRSKPYWIKERDNPQLGVYYVACGQLGVREAARMTQSLYGSNKMLRFDTEVEYLSKLNELRGAGKTVQGKDGL
jgi:hypothetical protein